MTFGRVLEILNVLYITSTKLPWMAILGSTARMADLNRRVRYQYLPEEHLEPLTPGQPASVNTPAPF